MESLFLELKQTGRGTDSLHPTSAAIENMWGFTSDLIYVFILFVKNIIFYCNILALSLILMTMYDVVNDFIYTYIYYKLEENMENRCKQMEEQYPFSRLGRPNGPNHENIFDNLP